FGSPPFLSMIVKLPALTICQARPILKRGLTVKTLDERGPWHFRSARGREARRDWPPGRWPCHATTNRFGQSRATGKSLLLHPSCRQVCPWGYNFAQRGQANRVA